MIVAVPKETFPGERRVALVPASVPALTKSGVRVQIEAVAGVSAGFTDDAYRAAGAEIVGYRFDEKAPLKADVDDVRFNFSPCYARVGNQFVSKRSD